MMMVVKKRTQQSNKETRGDAEEHSEDEGKRESDTSIFSATAKIILLGQQLVVPPVESILILKLGHRLCCAERVGIVGFSSSHILMAVEAKAAGHHGLQKYLYGSSIYLFSVG
jgi:hypothetical protein